MRRVVITLCLGSILTACGATAAAPSPAAPSPAASVSAASAKPVASVSAPVAASAKPASLGSAAPASPAASTAASAPANAKTVAVGTFPQAYINWPLVVGDKQGYFSAAGLKVDTKELPAVSTLLQALSTGQLNVVMTTPDTSMNAIYSGAPLTYIAVNQRPSTIDLLVSSKINSFADIKGKTLGVGQRDSSYSLLAEQMLKANGLDSSQYQFFYVASEPDRYVSLQSGKIDGAFLGPPRNFQAVGEGFHSLGLVNQYIQHDEYNGFVVNAPWASQNKDTVVVFLKAIAQADTWMEDPANKDAAIDMFQAYLKLDRPLVVQSYDLMITKLKAFPPDLKIDPAAHQAWIDNFVSRGVFTKPAPPLSKFVTDTYLQAAFGTRIPELG